MQNPPDSVSYDFLVQHSKESMQSYSPQADYDSEYYQNNIRRNWRPHWLQSTTQIWVSKVKAVLPNASMLWCFTSKWRMAYLWMETLQLKFTKRRELSGRSWLKQVIYQWLVSQHPRRSKGTIWAKWPSYFRLCHQNWKANQVATDNYSKWYKAWLKKLKKEELESAGGERISLGGSEHPRRT